MASYEAFGSPATRSSCPMIITHLVAHAPNAWGHIKPLLALLARMLELRSHAPLTLTFLSSAPMLPKIEQELRVISGPLAVQLNVIDVGVPATPFEPIKGFLTALETIKKGELVLCQTTSRKFSLPPITLVLLDAFLTAPVPVVKAAAGCAVFAWMPSPMSACLYLFGPESLGGYGDLAAKIDAVAKEQNLPKTEAAHRVYLREQGLVIRVAGTPDMYDYEYHPQVNVMPVSAAIFLLGAHRALLDADGVVVASFSAFEPEAMRVGREWIAQGGHDLWIVGPLEDAPPIAVPLLDQKVPRHSEEDTKVLGFLDDMKRTRGIHSVIFIAFGSTHYPKDPIKLHAFIEELLASDTPFLWSHASPMAKVPEELAVKIDTSQTGFHATWVPQRAVLKHPATGWFVSHGGWNSLQEALGMKVPTIMWPLIGDQPGNAALLSITHEAGFELLSIRDGPGARQPFRMEGKAPVDFSVDGVRNETRELLVKIKGSEGARVRVNAARLGDELEKSWQDGGEAREELRRFMHMFMSLP